MSHFVLIDGNNICFQTQTAAMEKKNRAKRLYCGEQETTVLNGLLHACRELQVRNPEGRLLMLWDTGRVWRYREYPEYKGNRKSNPDLVEAKEAIKLQKPHLFRILDAVGIPQVYADGYEADDIAAYLADKLSKAGHTVTLVTRDGDWLQMVRPGVNWFDRFTGKTCSALSFKAHTGFDNPDTFSEVKIFKGDAGDNVTGIKGVGDVAAEHLVREFGTGENFIEKWDEWCLNGGLDNKHPLNRPKKALNTFLSDAEAAKALVARNRMLMDLRTMYGNKTLAAAIRKTSGKVDEVYLKQRLTELAFITIARNLPVWMQPFTEQQRSKK